MPFIFLLLFTSLVFPMTSSCIDINNTIKEKVYHLIETSYPNLMFTELKFNALDSKVIDGCEYVKFNLPKKINFKNDLIIKFDLFQEDQFLSRITKVYRFSGKANVLRATKTLEKGFEANAESISVDNVDLRTITYQTISKINSVKMQFRNYINKNDIIEDWMLERIPDVKKGELIKTIIKKNNITLTLDGRVLENGNIGSKIKLQLNDKIVIGKLHDKKTVVINNI
ncbi:MAG: flagellar basal body P-ring formation chaperone FlgA [Candidatus Margulisiibacteriota bacterium]